MRLDFAGLRAAPVDAIIVVAAMAAVGLFLPDYDQWIHAHRWAPTHSVLPVVLTLVLLRSPAATTGMALDIAAHLSSDLFVHGMRMMGTATIKFWPFPGLNAFGTYVWLIANILACATIADHAAAQFAEPRWQVLLFGAALALATAYVIFHGEQIFTVAAMAAAFGGQRVIAMLRRFRR